jgi:NAD(P)-dependent dehydrogenase (short-subunit alcohol dehydrogenase family)
MAMKGVLDGKAIVITGSGRGIGAACAISAAEQGAWVVVNDVHEGQAVGIVGQIKEKGGIATSFVADISVAKHARFLIDKCCDDFGKIDGLVNNAGRFIQAPIQSLEEDDLRLMVDANLIGTVLCGKFAASRMLAQGTGRIINMTSGSMMGQVDTSIYGATKGAVSSLTYCWALDLEHTSIRVNAVSPYAESQMSISADKYRAQKGIPPRDHKMPAASSVTPLVNFLLSDLSENISGQVIRISGQTISVMSHPTLIHPAITREAWSPQDLAEVFQNELCEHLQPLGNHLARIEIIK